MEEALKEFGTRIELNTPMYVTLFTLGFICWFAFVLFILSRMGWNKFADRYSLESSFGLTRVGLISAKVGRINYSNSIILSKSENGMQFKALLPFRIGHSTFYIPFSDIKNTQSTKSFGQKLIEITFKDQYLPTLILQETTFHKLDLKTNP